MEITFTLNCPPNSAILFVKDSHGSDNEVITKEEINSSSPSLLKGDSSK